jgi:hypothetical protein
MLHASALSVSSSNDSGQLVLETARGRDGVIRPIEQDVPFDWRVHEKQNRQRSVSFRAWDANPFTPILNLGSRAVTSRFPLYHYTSPATTTVGAGG